MMKCKARYGIVGSTAVNEKAFSNLSFLLHAILAEPISSENTHFPNLFHDFLFFSL